MPLKRLERTRRAYGRIGVAAPAPVLLGINETIGIDLEVDPDNAVALADWERQVRENGLDPNDRILGTVADDDTPRFFYRLLTGWNDLQRGEH